MSVFKSKYYDHPEGTDALGKMIATNKIVASAGIAWSCMDVLMFTKTKGYMPTLARFITNTAPLMGIATAFTMTTYIATNVRGKDDRWNYVLGGLAAGSVVGAWRRNVFYGMLFGAFFGIAGSLKKLSIQEGWEFFPDSHHQHGSIGGTTHDWTLMREPERNWSTSKEC